MPVTVWPLDAVEGAPEYDGRALRQTGVVDLAYATSARPLGARSGVRPGTPDSTLSTTSTTWTVKPHAGVLDVLTAAEASAYRYAIDADATGAVDAAHATLPRKDLVYIELSDPAESEGSTPEAVVKYLAGTPATSGTEVVPDTPERSMRLGWIGVPASGGGSPTATFDAPFMAVAGAPIFVRSEAERDALDDLAALGFPIMVERLDTGTLERNAGDGWVPIYPGPFAMAAGVATIPSGSPTGVVDVTLPAGRFSVTPIVTVAPENSVYNAQFVPGASSSSSIRLGLTLIAGGSWSTPRQVYWTATQMTPGSASG